MPGPTLVSVLPLDALTLRVTWSQDVKQDDAAESDDALNPENYSLGITTVPAVTPVVTSVAGVSVGTTAVLSQVDLTLDIDQSPDAGYVLTAENVTGLVGTTWVPTPGTPTAAFTGYRPPQPAGRRWSLWGMLPQKNRDDDATGDLRLLISCWQDVVDILLARIDGFPDIWDYEDCPAPYLDALLYGLGNPFPFVMTDTEKRKLLAVLMSLYHMKGTEVGLIDALRFFLGAVATIDVPWESNWRIPDDRLGGTDTTGQVFTAEPVTDRLVLSYTCPFEDEDPVDFSSDGTLPAGLLVGTVAPTRYVRDIVGTSFAVSATPGGIALDMVDAGTGTHKVYCRDPGTAQVGPGYAGERNWAYGFIVYLDIALTEDQRNRALLIIDFMRPLRASLISLWEAGVLTWP